MKNKFAPQSAFSSPRVLIGFLLCSVGVLLALFGSGIFPRASALAQEPKQNDPNYGLPHLVPMVGPVSQDNDLRALPYIPPNRENEEKRLTRHPLPLVQSNAKADPVQTVRQSTQAVAMPTPIATFDGMNSTQSGCGCLPPDTDGDVGPNHYVQSVNSSIKIFDKTGAAQNGVNGTTYNSFFSPLGSSTPCGNNQNDGDGFVLYDHLADRWVVSDFAFPAFPGTSFYQCIGVSRTSDPVQGGWWLYALQVDPANPSFIGDYPKFGLWPDAYYLTVNLFSNSTTFQGVRVFALPRNAMLNGTGAPNPGAVAFNISPATLGDAYSLVPATFRTGTAPSAGTPEYFMAINSSATPGTVENQVFVWLFLVDFVTPGNSTFGVGAAHAPNGTVTVNGFVDAFTNTTKIVPQNGTTAMLDTLGDKLMTPLVYQNLGGVESLYASHTINNNQNGTGPTAIRWYQFNVSGGTIPATPAQQQTFNNGADGLWRWMPSLAVDAQGNMAIGYSVSSSSTDPAIRYAGRLANDPLNSLAQGEAELIAGGGHQTNTAQRWGDYSATSVDPADGLTFWHTNEYYSATSSASWNTRIGKFKFPTPNLIVAGGSAIVSAGPNGIPDPGETITVSLGVQNSGTGGCTVALNGTLQATGGVTNPSPAQSYGAVCTGGSVVFHDFTFTVDPSLPCGTPITASLAMTDGVTNYGTLTYTFNTGTSDVGFSENFDGGATLPAGWTTAASGGESAWIVSAVSSSSLPNDVFAPDPTTVGNTELVTPSIAIPASGGQLTFQNLYNMQASGGTFYDGMVLEISINGGAFADIIAAGGSFVTGGYSGTISSGFSSPIGGRPAWSGLSGGTTSAPTYITSSVNLPAAAAGQSIRLKWRAATDSRRAAAGLAGVRIDTISITSPICAPIPLSVASWKTHGGAGDFHIDLPLTGTRGIECRAPGQLPGGAAGDYQIIFTFPNNLTNVGGVSASATAPGGGTQTVGASGQIGSNAAQYIVNLSGVPNEQYVTVTLIGVLDSAGDNGDVLGPPMGVLLGDVNASGNVDAADIGLVQRQNNKPVSSSPRADVNLSGNIDAADAGLTQRQNSKHLP